jgi:hypothetical protein
MLALLLIWHQSTTVRLLYAYQKSQEQVQQLLHEHELLQLHLAALQDKKNIKKQVEEKLGFTKTRLDRICQIPTQALHDHP